jgi:ATP-dependent protease ClpP protease subunit
MAFIIHQYGNKRYMLDRSVLMSHFAASGVEGDIERMTSYLNVVQKYVNRFFHGFS